MYIKLETIRNVNDFAAICNEYYNMDINIKQGQLVMNGKSILGIYSLDLLNPIFVLTYTKDIQSAEEFYNRIKKWEVA